MATSDSGRKVVCCSRRILCLSGQAIVGKLVYPGAGRVLMRQGAGVRRLMMRRRHVVGLWVPRELGLPEPTRVGGLLDDRARVLDESTALWSEAALRLAALVLYALVLGTEAALVLWSEAALVLWSEAALRLAALVLYALVLGTETALLLGTEAALVLWTEAALVLGAEPGLVLGALVLAAGPALVLAAGTPVLRKHRACRR